MAGWCQFLKQQNKSTKFNMPMPEGEQRAHLKNKEKQFVYQTKLGGRTP